MAAVEYLVDSPSKKVLVLCQRKTGKCTTPSEFNVEDKIVPQINSFVSILFPKDTVVIEYLTDGIAGAKNCDADYCIELAGSDGEDFLKRHPQYYDVVILNTCPLPLMIFSMIHKILNNNGL